VADGVFRSTDEGETWEHASPTVRVIPAAIGRDNQTALMMMSPNFVEDGIIFAGTTQDGVIRSTDGGDTWIQKTKGLADPVVIAVAISPNFAQDSTVFVGTEGGGVFRSVDGGDTWEQVNLGLTVTFVLAVALSPAFEADQTIYAGTWGGGVFKGSNLELGTVTRTPTPAPLSPRTRAIMGWSIIATMIALVTSAVLLRRWWTSRPDARGRRRMGTWPPPPW